MLTVLLLHIKEVKGKALYVNRVIIVKHFDGPNLDY